MAALSPPTSSSGRTFRFRDLPSEIRDMIYDLLFDRLFRRCFDQLQIYGTKRPQAAVVFGCFHPSLLRVSKRFSAEYSHVMLKHAGLFIQPIYRPDDEAILAGPIVPRDFISKLRSVDLGYRIEHEWPPSDPFAGLIELLPKMRNLKVFVLTMCLHVDHNEQFHDITVPGSRARQFSRYLQIAQHNMAMIWKLSRGRVKTWVRWRLHCRIYDLWPRMSSYDLRDPNKPPLSPPVWQESIFVIEVNPCTDSFVWRGLNLRFLCVNNKSYGEDAKFAENWDRLWKQVSDSVEADFPDIEEDMDENTATEQEDLREEHANDGNHRNNALALEHVDTGNADGGFDEALGAENDDGDEMEA